MVWIQGSQTALRHGGKNVAVLGSGIDVIYPAEKQPPGKRDH
jgi:predicted Rossmann fold nucleotide-binding protein DprA/Smf involved in DNA uptake